MAKSIRSKWKRKMRAVKRERYGKKELDRLVKTLGIENAQPTASDVNMEDVSEIVTVVSADHIKKKTATEDVDLTIMDKSEIDNIKKFNPKTLRNENGAYPIWVHPRKIRKAKKSNKKDKSKVTKKNKRGKTRSSRSS